MVQQASGLHHVHKRKRRLEKYPHPNKLKGLLDRWIYVVGVAGPLMTIPQLYTLWSTRDAGSLSLSTWSAYLVIAIIWIIYGILHKEKPLVAMYTAWLLIHISVVVGIIIF
jgi:MtN3 and saliva related transmembrane protein